MFLNYAIETLNLIFPYSTYTTLCIKKWDRNNELGDKVSCTICQVLINSVSTLLQSGETVKVNLPYETDSSFVYHTDLYIASKIFIVL